MVENMLVSVMSSTYFKKGADQLLVNSGLETKGLQHRRLQLYQSEKTSSRTKPINPFKLFHCSRTLRSFWTRCPKARLDPLHTRSIHTASLPTLFFCPALRSAWLLGVVESWGSETHAGSVSEWNVAFLAWLWDLLRAKGGPGKNAVDLNLNIDRGSIRPTSRELSLIPVICQSSDFTR